MRHFALISILLFVGTTTADDLTGKAIKVKENGLKLGRKSGGGLVRDGEVLDSMKTYTVKADDGTYLEIEGGFVSKNEVDVLKDLPKMGAKASKPKDDWTNKIVMPKKPSKEIRIGDWVDDKHVSWEPHDLMCRQVRDDRDGYLRVFDGRREGWVSKEDFVRTEEASVYWDKALKANPKDTHALHMRGIGWCQKNDFDKALKDFDECIRLLPKSSIYFAERSYVWLLKDDYDKAIADSTEAIRLDPKNTTAFISRGVAWRNQKNYDKAIADCTEAIRIDPKDISGYITRGIVFNRMNSYDKAITDFNEAVRLDPNDADVYISRGNAWSNKKDNDKAIADYTEAIRLDPTNTLAYDNRGIAWNIKKDYKKAIVDYTEAIRLDPNYGPFYKNRGIAWINNKVYEKAISDCNEAIRLDPKFAPSYYYRSVAECLIRKPATDGFQGVLTVQGWKGEFSTYAVINYSIAARLQNDDKAAIKMLEDSKGKLDEAWPFPIVRFLRGDLDEAALLKLAVENDKRTEAYCALGYDRLIRGDKEKARKHFEWVKEKGNSTFMESTMSIAELDRLDKEKK